MGKGYLIDTNAIIDYTSNLYPEKGLNLMDNIINSGINISIINKIEALAYIPKTKKQFDSFKIVKQFVRDAYIFDLTDKIVNETIKIRKIFELHLPDAIIAATALTYDLILVTRNTKDFQHVEGISLINPHKDF